MRSTAREGQWEGLPGDEENEDAVRRHAKYLGIDPEKDAAYIWIAEEALNADVPEGWITGEGEGEYEGLVFYYNEATNESTWDHPLDEFYRQKFKKKKAREKARSPSHHGSTKSHPSSTKSKHHGSDRSKSAKRDDGGGSEVGSDAPQALNTSRARSFQNGKSKSKPSPDSRHGSGDKSRSARGPREVEDEKQRTHEEKRRSSSRDESREHGKGTCGRRRTSAQNSGLHHQRRRHRSPSQRSSSPLSSSKSSDIISGSEARSVSLRGSWDSTDHRCCRTTDESKHYRDKQRDRQRLSGDSTIGKDRGRWRNGQVDGRNKEASALLGVGLAAESPREEERGRRSEVERNDGQRSGEEISDDAGGNRRESPREQSRSGASNAERSESHRHRHNDRGDIRHVNLSKTTYRRHSHHSGGHSAPGKAETGAPNSTRRESDVSDYSHRRDVDAGINGTDVDHRRRRRSDTGEEAARQENFESSRGVTKVSSKKNDTAGATTDEGGIAKSREADNALELTPVESAERRSERAESPEPHRVSGTSGSRVRVSEASGGEHVINADAVPETKIHRDESGGAGKASEWDGELQEVDFDEELLDIEDNITDDGNKQSTTLDHRHALAVLPRTETASDDAEVKPDAENGKTHRIATKVVEVSAVVSATRAGRRAPADGKDDGEMDGDGRRHPGTAEVASIPLASGAFAGTGTEQQAAETKRGANAVVEEINWRNRDASSSPAETRNDGRPTRGVSTISTDITATPVPADLDQWKEPPARTDNHREAFTLPTGASLKGGGDRHEDLPGDRSENRSADRSLGPSADGSAQRTENRSETRVADRIAEDYSEGQSPNLSISHGDVDKYRERGSYGDIGLKGDGREDVRGEQATSVRRSEIGRGYGVQASHAYRKRSARSPEREVKANRRGAQQGRRYSHDERADDDSVETRHHRRSPRNAGNAAAVGGRGEAVVDDEHAKNSRGWPFGGTQRHSHENFSRVSDGRRGGGQDDDRRGQRRLSEGGRYYPEYDMYDEDDHRSSFRSGSDGYGGELWLPRRCRRPETFGERRSCGRGWRDEEEDNAMLKGVTVLRAAVERLERALSEAKSTEDSLREELSEAVKRDATCRKRHATALEEGSARTAEAQAKLSTALFQVGQMDVRVAEAQGKAAASARTAADRDWQTKMVESEANWKAHERDLRVELEAWKERVKAVEESAAQRKAEVLAASGRGAHDHDDAAPGLRATLKDAEEELKIQASCLAEVQCQHAEASVKLSSTVRELQKNVELAERHRLEAADCRSRACTSEAALAQAARDIATLNDALARVRAEATAKDNETGKAVAEMHRLRSQLTFAQEKSNMLEERIAREKASFESLLEGVRGRVAELEAANACMERQIRNGNEDSLNRLRETEKERDTALYEDKLSAERATTAEGWRQKERLRADAAEAAATNARAETAALMVQLGKIEPDAEETIASYIKKIAELETQLGRVRREAEKLEADQEHLRKTHSTEISSLRAEVSTKIPEIVEHAAEEAGRQWRRRAEAEISAVKSERDRRLGEFQAAVAEAEARRHGDLADIRVEAERFRTVAEKLAVENRSLRQEMERIATRHEAPSSFEQERAMARANRPDEGGKTRRCDRGEGDIPDPQSAHDATVHAQLLGKVEAHINYLRAQLHAVEGSNSADLQGVFERGSVGDAYASSPGARADQRATPPHFRREEGSNFGALEGSGGGVWVTPLSANGTWSSCHDLQRQRRDAGGGRGEGGLTPEEEMHLCRLLRCCSKSYKSTPAASPSLLFSGRGYGHVLSRAAVHDRRDNCEGGTLGPAGSARISGGCMPREGDGASVEGGELQSDDDGKSGNHMAATRGSCFGGVSSDKGGVARELFPSEEVKQSTSTTGVQDVDGAVVTGSGQAFYDGWSTRTTTTSDLGGMLGVCGGVPTTGNGVQRGKRRGIVMGGGGGGCEREDADDLEDISDGGFHPGCWRRKYASGEMR